MPVARPDFPPVTEADEDGLLALGGSLDRQWVIAAYERGIFPWPITYGGVELLAWFAPDPRAIIELDELRVSRRLARRVRSGRYRVTIDRCFDQVMLECAGPRRGEAGTWITSEMRQSYGALHLQGVAHSVEAWEGEALVGGIYGVSLGGFFAGESMFYRSPDASKVALVYLVAHLKSRGFSLFDIQQATPPSLSMGAREIPRTAFQARLERARRAPVTFGQRIEAQLVAQLVTAQ